MSIVDFRSDVVIVVVAGCISSAVTVTCVVSEKLVRTWAFFWLLVQNNVGNDGCCSARAQASSLFGVVSLTRTSSQHSGHPKAPPWQLAQVVWQWVPGFSSPAATRDCSWYEPS